MLNIVSLTKIKSSLSYRIFKRIITPLSQIHRRKMSSLLTGGLADWEKKSYSSSINESEKMLASNENGVCTPHNSDKDLKKKENNKNSDGIDVLSRCSPVLSNYTIEEKLKIILSIKGECVQPDELRLLLEKDKPIICYDGFEPSGRMHIAQGLLKAINVNKLTSCGCVFVFWVADWFALLNNKMNGDLNKIQTLGKYFIEVWKAVEMNMSNVLFLWSSEEINNNSNMYWLKVLDVAKTFNITRMKRCSQIMGRTEGDDQPSSQILYPCMQCADIFFLKADICQLGLDQRKVNMLAREYCDEKKLNKKPIILSHSMLPGLLEGQDKMSKSNPDSSIFMEDTEEDIRRKVKKAYCPPMKIENNPIIVYIEHIIFPKVKHFYIKRTESNGGNIKYEDLEILKNDYLSGSLHPGDVKSAFIEHLNNLIKPVRDHFQNNPKAKALLDEIKSF